MNILHLPENQLDDKDMGEVIYGVFDNSMWELHVLLKDTDGSEHYVRWVRCDDKRFPTLISRKVREFEKNFQNFRVYLDGELVHETDYR